MRVIYEGVDITSQITVVKCVVKDTVNKADSLYIEFDNPRGWYSWNPQEDDRLVVQLDGYDSGLMYVNAIIPDDGKFALFATSLPCNARSKAYKSYKNTRVEDIIRSCASISHMDYQIFGINANEIVPYIERCNEGCASFLNRLCELEGAILKCVNGKYTVIGIEYIQNQVPSQVLNINANQRGIQYKRNGMKKKRLILKSPYVSVTSEDTSVSETHESVISNEFPILTKIQGRRWAKNILLKYNRNTELIEMNMKFNPLMTAMLLIGITGNTLANGSWITDEVTHDLINKTTKVIMKKSINTIKISKCSIAGAFQR